LNPDSAPSARVRVFRPDLEDLYGCKIGDEAECSGSRTSRIREVMLLVIAMLPWVAMSAALLPRVHFGAENLRVVEVLSRDESWVAFQLSQAWEHKLPLYRDYGDLYWNVGLVSLLVSSSLRSIDQKQAVTTLRLVSLACFLLIGLMGYLWGRRLTGPIGGFAFSSLLFIMISADADSIHRVVYCQPDMLNLLASLAAFLACMELAVKLGRARLLLAAGTAGLVMAVKHSGFLFLPLIVIILLFHALYSDEESLLCHASRVEIPLLRFQYAIGALLVIAAAMTPLLLRRGHTLSILPIPAHWPRLLGLGAFGVVLMVSCALLLGFRAVRAAGCGLLNRAGFLYSSVVTEVGAFVVVFGMTSPSSWLGLRFAGPLIAYAGTIHQITRPIGGWARLILRDLPGPFPVMLILVGTGIVIYGTIRSGLRKASKRDLASLVWAALTVCFIVAYVGFVQHRYLFPVLPAMCWLAALPISYVNDLLRRRGDKLKLLSAVLIVLWCIYAGCLIRRQALETKANFSSLQSEPGFQAGQWMDANLPSKTVIIQNFGVYIPTRFKWIIFDAGDPYRQLEKYDPDVVVVNTQETLMTAHLPAEAIEQPVFYIRVGTVRRFYADLLAQRLGFKQVVTFSDRARGFDVVILRREGESPDFRREANLNSTDSPR
jgi:hypothetical protein